jgi:hypothetical protein
MRRRNLAQRVQHASGARYDCRPRPVWQDKVSGESTDDASQRNLHHAMDGCQQSGSGWRTDEHNDGCDRRTRKLGRSAAISAVGPTAKVGRVMAAGRGIDREISTRFCEVGACVTAGLSDSLAP